MAQGSFSAAVSAWVAQTKERAHAVFRESIERTLEVAQEVGPSVTNPTSTGPGHMPVATGFLRASLQVRVGDSLPAATRNPGEEFRHSYDAGGTTLVLAQVQIGDVVTAAWTAEYARYVEHRYAFLRLAAQQWPRIVSEVALEANYRARAARP